MSILKFVFIIACSVIAFNSCTKDFLNDKPNSKLVIPETLEDMQKLLDNDNVMVETPVLGELSSDDYFITSSNWDATVSVKDKNAYIWQKDVFEGNGTISDWNVPYQQVLYANVVLNALDEFKATDINFAEWSNIKGSALFIRAYAFYNLVQIFATTLDSATFATDLGIPIRLSPEINGKTSRATVKETYDQILSDLIFAKDLLFASVPLNNRNRPSKPAALSLLSRIYLNIGNYTKAGIFADSALQFYNTLIDYNQISLTGLFPFTRLNSETIYQSRMSNSEIMTNLVLSNGYSVDSTLYSSYDSNDLRKLIFFQAVNPGFKNTRGSYNQSILPFTGLATDELYLIRAECYARMGEKNLAMVDLNNLLKTRWKKVNNISTYTDRQAANSAEALSIILTERRKELCFRGLRWADLKRLNKSGANIIAKRIINGQTVLLQPNSPLYVMPIPPDVVALSGISQNER